MKYAFIDERWDYPVVKWAQFLEVSASGYYRWRSERAARQGREQAYAEEVESIFRAGEGTYGADRIIGVMRKRGQAASYAKVKRVMNERGLHSVHLRCQRSLTDSRRARGDEYRNLLKSAEITGPFQAVTSDISYIPTDEGFDYLCTIKDLTGVVLAEKMSERMTKELVLDTIRAAQKRWKLPAGTIYHSDRGSQYTSGEVMALVAKLGFQQSFSAVGRPGDNAWSESFYSILKKESVHHVHFATRSEARQAMFDYIERFYNRRRVQKSLGYLSPIDWLNARFSTAA